MAAKIPEGKSLSREFQIPEIAKPVIITMSEGGLKMHVKGQPTVIFASWTQVISRAMNTPENVPSFLMGKPLELLKHKGKLKTS